MGIPIFQVDAFTDKPFSGNPAAICILREPQEESWMRNVAGEMNLSETAFLLRKGDGFNLRWFTPKMEVDLCGHATLAAAHILWEEGRLSPGQPARFYTRGGLLTAERERDWIEMDFPAEPEKECVPPPNLVQALGVGIKYTGRNRLDYLVEVESEDCLRNLRPDLALLASLPARGVIATCLSSASEYDFVSRFFAPGAGIDEDPVTGSAHCCLGPFWASRLGKTEFLACQVSSRGGVLRVRLGNNRAFLGGQAVTVLRGELLE